MAAGILRGGQNLFVSGTTPLNYSQGIEIGYWILSDSKAGGLLDMYTLSTDASHQRTSTAIAIGTRAGLNAGRVGTLLEFTIPTLFADSVLDFRHLIHIGGGSSTEEAVTRFVSQRVQGGNNIIRVELLVPGSGFADGDVVDLTVEEDSVDIPLTYHLGHRGHLTSGGNLYIPFQQRIVVGENVEAIFYNTLA